MPSSLLGLLIYVYILIPGLCYHVVRRRLIPTQPVTTIVDAAHVIFAAMITNALTLICYSVLQLLPWISEHSPSVVHLLRDPREYLLLDNSRLVYVGAWAVVLLTFSCALARISAFWFAPNVKTRKFGVFSRIWERYPARIVDVSVWDYYFHCTAPDGSIVYLVCHLHDGSYAAGALDWYNTDIDDSPDRDLVLGVPLTVMSADGRELTEKYSERVILSARDIRQIIVTYVACDAIRNTQNRVLSDNSEKLS